MPSPASSYKSSATTAARKCIDVFNIEVFEPIVVGVLKEHLAEGYVFAQSKIVKNKAESQNLNHRSHPAGGLVRLIHKAANLKRAHH